MANKKGVSSKTHTQQQLNDYANQHNPNNKAYKANKLGNSYISYVKAIRTQAFYKHSSKAVPCNVPKAYFTVKLSLFPKDVYKDKANKVPTRLV